ncbi:hypothetical protein BGZ76_010611 [Entomortierella beljakovae]|nr:hypothetical protein BGZ76_010611 [Entomortierella beljakovae]
MVYYVSWMKLLKTVTTTGNKSPKNGSQKKFKSSSKSTSPSQSPELISQPTSSLSPSSYQGPPGLMNEVVVRDPYGRLEAKFANLAISGATTVQGFTSDKVVAGSNNSRLGDDSNRKDKEGGESGDEDDDEDDGDPSGLLKLAEISDKFLTHLLPQTPSLLELYIHSPKQFSDESLVSLANSCRLVRLLEFIGCTKISDHGLDLILDSCPDLHTLTLSNNGPARITDRTISQLAMSVINSKHTSSSSPSSVSSPSSSPRGQRLQVLNLSCASNFVTGQHPGLLSIAIWCTNLVSLDLSFCHQDVNDEFLRILSAGGVKITMDSDNNPLPSTISYSDYDDNLASDDITSTTTITTTTTPRPRSTLRYLSLAHCTEITDKGLAWLAKGCPELRVLDITALCLVTDQSIMEISKNCPSFQRLVMDEKYGTRITQKFLNSYPWGSKVTQHDSSYNKNVRRGSRTF